jgi:hypothetical protein
MLSVMYITVSEEDDFTCMFSEGEKRRAWNQLITFARCRHETLPIEYRDLP